MEISNYFWSVWIILRWEEGKEMNVIFIRKLWSFGKGNGIRKVIYLGVVIVCFVVLGICLGDRFINFLDFVLFCFSNIVKWRVKVF